MASQVTENVLRIALPDWTEHSSKNGRDPLGMQSSSVALYQDLLPGISNVTLRIRYYGLYAWLCKSYLKTNGDSNLQSWQKFLRRSEALYALIAQNLGTETGVAGTNWAAEALETGETTIDFAEAAKPTQQGKPRRYLKQKFGVYGAAYASQLFVTGVFAESQGIAIPAPSREVGSVLAKSFQEEAGPLADRFLQIVNLAKVTRDDLRDLSPLTPSSIRNGSDECNCYQWLLFASLLDRPDDLERSKTLKLILAVANRLMKTPTAQEVRWMLYENRDLDGAEFTFGSPQLDQQRLRWWVYQANDLIHIAYESLLKVLLDIVGLSLAGIGPEKLLAGMVEKVRENLNDWPDKWDDFLDRCRPNGSDPESEIAEDLVKKFHPAKLSPPDTAERALTLLAIIHDRARKRKQDIHSELQSQNSALSHSLLTEFRFLESNCTLPFDEFLQKLIERRIINRHFWVALRKLRYQRDYTFLMESVDGRIRLKSKDGPVFTNPRLSPAISFLRDSHLLNDEGLTAQGKAILESV